MCKRMSLSSFVGIFLLANAALFATQEPVGMVIESSGKLIVERGGDRRPAQLAELLYSQDRLVVTDGDAAFLFCPGSQKVRMAQGSTVRLGGDEFLLDSGTAPTISAVGRCALPRFALGSESLERAGAVQVRDSTIPVVALYLGGPLLDPDPEFAWAPVENADRYSLTLKSLSGEKLWGSTTTATSARAGSPLKPGQYQWEVDALQGDRVIARDSTRFEIVEGSSESLAENNLLVRAVDLEISGFFAEAAALYRQLKKSNQDDGRISRHLEWLYTEAGLMAAAKAEGASRGNPGQ